MNLPEFFSFLRKKIKNANYDYYKAKNAGLFCKWFKNAYN